MIKLWFGANTWVRASTFVQPLFKTDTAPFHTSNPYTCADKAGRDFPTFWDLTTELLFNTFICFPTVYRLLIRYFSVIFLLRSGCQQCMLCDKTNIYTLGFFSWYLMSRNRCANFLAQFLPWRQCRTGLHDSVWEGLSSRAVWKPTSPFLKETCA